MKTFNRTSIALMVVLLFGATANSGAIASESQRHVVTAGDIQARIDQKMDKDAANRQAIQLMLQRDDVREIAGRAGLSMERANAAVAVLSGSELENLGARATEINAGVGGSDQIVISATALIIILLVIIIVAN